MNTNTERMRKLKHHLYWEISQENKIHFQKKIASCLSVGHAIFMYINIAIKICALYKRKFIKIYKNHRNISNKVWNVHSINIHVIFQS